MPKRIIKPVVCLVSLLALIGVKPVLAMEHIRQHVPQAQKVGEARMSVMLWDIYDAALYAPDGQWKANSPFALTLSYLRELKGDKIADRSVQEMRKQGFSDEVRLATWHSQMRDIFPDVKDGDVLSGILTQEGHTIFYKGNEEIGRIKDTAFGNQFFSIWLSPDTSAQDLRLSLLGQNIIKESTYNETVEGYNSHVTNRMH